MQTGDPLWMHVLLAIHIAAGAVCLVMAPLVLAVAKGGPRHRRWGKIYFWSMAAVAATALPMALFRPVLFLALVAILTFYMAFSGYRALSLKDLADGGSAKLRDWAAAIVTFAACAGLAGFAVLQPAWVQHMGVIAVVLGVLGLRVTAVDMHRFVHKPTRRMFWLFTHFERFMGSYIAAWTAFSAVTLSRIFPHAVLAVWLWPIAFGLPVIAATAAYYRRKHPAGVARAAMPA
ncbi:MAG: hypothetical protein KGJ79_00040 [Alphaproteobacteria bacterium]|nr:hypothetical protein [Alphaproteobacteria bacterium]MDE2109500.1 hypothetical protein [Alphaproteobacteria bacterium]MDE2495353.1 hypothetical protein [Alphaproteobacteria bacterium]